MCLSRNQFFNTFTTLFKLMEMIEFMEMWLCAYRETKFFTLLKLMEMMLASHYLDESLKMLDLE